MFDTVSISEAAKWIALVFAAGFIGFFGKSFARTVLSVFRKEKEKRHAQSEPSGNFPSPQGGSLPDTGHGPGVSGNGSGKDGQKAFKKASKAQEKAMKKQGKK